MPPRTYTNGTAAAGGSTVAAGRSATTSHGFLRVLSGGRYLSSTMCRNLLQYKYDGEDRSFLYRYVLQPMNARLIQFVPIWAAPNLITTVGLSLMIAAYLATYYYSPNFDQLMPPWMYLCCAFALFGYQTIDNLDGRQARRTGSSSPLGLLFDHGVDALNCTFASLLLASVYSIGQHGPIVLFLFWNIGFIPFVLATWEEYFTGKLTLAEVNGPSDGMFLCMIFSSSAFFKPGLYFMTLGTAFPSLFSDSFVANLPTSYLPLIIGYVGIVATIGGNFYQVSKKVTSWSRPLSKLLPFLLLGILSWSWVFSDPALFSAHSRIYCFSCGFLFCQMICSLMIAHVCHADYEIKRPVLLPLIISWINCVGGPFLLPQVFPLISPATTLFFLFAFNFFGWFHFISNVILEITELLNIKCFKIVPKDVGHDGSTPAVVAAYAAAQINSTPTGSPIGASTLSGRHTGILPHSNSVAEKLMSQYPITPSPSPTANSHALRKKSSTE